MDLPLEDSSDETLRDLIEAVCMEVQYRVIHTNSVHRHDQLEGASGYLHLAFLCIDKLVRKPKELPADD